MANQKITELSSAGAVTGSELLVVVQGGSSKKATASGVLNGAVVTATGSSTARSLASRTAERVNVKDYGTVGDGSTDDRAAAEAAFAAAEAAGKTVYFPPGRYKLLYDNSHSGYTHTSPLTLLGDGPETTVLDLYPKTLGASVANGGSLPDFHVVKATAASATFRARELRVEGASAASVAGYDTTTLSGLYSYANNSGTVTVEATDVEMVGDLMHHGISLYSASGTARLTRVKVDNLETGFEWYGNHTDATKFLYLTDCDIKVGTAAENTTSNDDAPYGVGVYLHPEVAIQAINVYFHDCPRDAIKNYASSNLSTYPSPAWNIFTGCTFSNCAASIITPGQYDITSQINNCSFVNSPLIVRNDVVINNSVFRESSVGTGPHGDAETWRTRISGCDFYTNTPGTKLIDDIDGAVEVRGCTFNFGAAADDTCYAFNVALPTETTVEGCTFISSSTATNKPSMLKWNSSSGSHLCRDNRVTGPFKYIFQFQSNSASVVFDCEDNDLRLATLLAGNAWLSLNTGNVAYLAGITAKGNKIPASASYGGQYPAVARPASAYNPTAVASASTVTLDPTFSEFRITGTTQINTLRFSGNYTGFSGTIKLIADGAWSTGSSGNISAATASARTVGNVYEFYLDHLNNTWVEIGGSGGGGSPGGSSGDLQYNNAGALGGFTGVTRVSDGVMLLSGNASVGGSSDSRFGFLVSRQFTGSTPISFRAAPVIFTGTFGDAPTFDSLPTVRFNAGVNFVAGFRAQDALPSGGFPSGVPQYGFKCEDMTSGAAGNFAIHTGVGICRIGDTLLQTKHAAPADADLENSSFALWLTDTPGSTVLNIKAKDSGGTVRTATVSLS